VLAASEGTSFSLRDARRFYTDTCLRWLLSIVRRLVWCDLLKASEVYESVDGDPKTELMSRVVRPVRALFLLLSCPFYVDDEVDRKTAVREAAQR